MFVRLQFKCLTKHNNVILLGTSHPLLRHLLSELLFGVLIKELGPFSPTCNKDPAEQAPFSVTWETVYFCTANLTSLAEPSASSLYAAMFRGFLRLIVC